MHFTTEPLKIFIPTKEIYVKIRKRSEIMTKTSFKGSIMLNPVPAVLITSRNKENIDNIFTVGWIGTACTKPPMITVAIRPERLSHKYILESNCFVVNLAPTSLVKTVDYCGVKSGKTTNKIADMNLSLSQGKEINCGIIDQCPVSFECVVKSVTPLGSHDLFLAEIVQCHVDDSLIDSNGKIHFEKADLLTYSHGEYFGLNPKVLGTFGYSVRKKPLHEKKTSDKSSKSLNKNNSFYKKNKNTKNKKTVKTKKVKGVK